MTSSKSPILPHPPTARMSTHSSVSSDSARDSGRSPFPSASSSPERLQPIPAPSEPMQYRAIGLIRGRYQPSTQLTQGTLIASDGTPIDAVLLGRMMGLLKKHLDLSVEHLWVVYPRTRENAENLHVQIVGVWEPETLDESEADSAGIDGSIGDNYFSVRGEVIFYCPQTDQVKVKINQAPRKKGEKPRSFKLDLKGTLPGKIVKNFWEFHLLREGSHLVIQEALWIASMPKPQRSWSPRRTEQRSPQRRDGAIKQRTRETPKPVLPSAGLPRPTPPPPIIRRRKPSRES